MAYVDDVYFYDSLANAPRCDGTYPDGIDDYTGDENNPGLGNDDTPITYPPDKPCPPDVVVPNNFWGQILSQLTLFLDQLFAFMPFHQPNSLTQLTQDLIGSPIGTFSAVIGVLFDLKIPVLMASLFLILESARGLWSVWIAIKKSIPFMN